MNTRSEREVVAVTASGVNDDKVLRAADVGLTMVIVHNICAVELIDFAIVAKEQIKSLIDTSIYGRELMYVFVSELREGKKEIKGERKKE